MNVPEYLCDTKREPCFRADLRRGKGSQILLFGYLFIVFGGLLFFGQGGSCLARTSVLPGSSSKTELIYRRMDENGTVYLTNRPDGDDRYVLFGRFLDVGVGMFGVERLLERVGSEGVTRLADRYARVHGVDAGLILAIIKTESDGKPTAVSRAGARGLMQLMPGTQRDLGVQNVFDPEENIEGGVRYFRSMLERYNGNVEIALAAYNAGPATVDKYGGVPPFLETRKYIRRVVERWKEREGENRGREMEMEMGKEMGKERESGERPL